MSRRRSTSAVSCIESLESISQRAWHQPNYSPDHPVRDRHRCVSISPCFRLCLLVGTLSGEQDQWWQGALYQESPRQEPRCHCVTHGRELAASRQRLSRRVLSAYHSQARHPKQSPPQLRNSHALCITCSALKKPTTKPSFTAAMKKFQDALNFGSADRPLNSGFKSSPYTTGDVPWESASRPQLSR